MSSIKHFLHSSSSRGVTTTHPWCSVFKRISSFIVSIVKQLSKSVKSMAEKFSKMKDNLNFKKLIALVICSIFVFSSICINVNAAISNIPEMNDWQFAQAIDAYAGLTDDQKDIANFLIGSQGYAFAGIAQSNLNSNFSSYSETVNYVKDFGAKMWDEFNTHVDGVVESGRNNLRAVKNDLSNFFGNAVTYAKSRSESFSAWLGNVGIDYNSSSEFRIQFGKDQAQNNVDYFGDQGLYNWQHSSLVLDPAEFQFVWYSTTLSGSNAATYYQYLSQIPFPHVYVNWDSSHPNFITGGTFFSTYSNIFVNTTTQNVYLCDDNGNPAPSLTELYPAVVYTYSSGYPVYDPAFTRISCFTFSSANYGTLASLFDALSANPGLLITFNSYNMKFSLSDFVTNLWVGSSWSSKAPWTADYDLNLSSTSQYVTINAPTNVIYLDLTGFMRDLYDNPTIIYNYVINNSVDGNGDPVDGDDFKPISKFPGIPDSGITIGTEFFKINGLNPFFGPDGYIAVLWNNTKGLVSYLASVLSMLTFDGGNSPAFVIYGAIAVGVIGGIFSKFLL